MAEDDISELAGRLRYHLQALTSELGLAGSAQSEQRPAATVSPSLAQQRVMIAKAWVSASAAPGRAFQDDGMFANPALNLLLDLYINHAEHRRISITSACIAAGVPPTTGLRWIERLVGCGYVERAADAGDGRRALLWISDSGRAAMDTALDAVAESDRKLGMTRFQLVE